MAKEVWARRKRARLDGESVVESQVLMPESATPENEPIDEVRHRHLPHVT